MAVKKGKTPKKNIKLGGALPPHNALPSSLMETPLIQACIAQESGDNSHLKGDDAAIGDKTLANQAYGCLQIRQPVLTDVNSRFGTTYKPTDMLNNRTLSVWIFNAYMLIYALPQRLGRPVTDQDRARIWNGGPNGYKIAATQKYWVYIQQKAKLLKVTLS